MNSRPLTPLGLADQQDLRTGLSFVSLSLASDRWIARELLQSMGIPIRVHFSKFVPTEAHPMSRSTLTREKKTRGTATIADIDMDKVQP